MNIKYIQIKMFYFLLHILEIIIEHYILYSCYYDSQLQSTNQ